MVIMIISRDFISHVAAEEEAERAKDERNAAVRLTKVALRAGLSLREMIELGKRYIVLSYSYTLLEYYLFPVVFYSAFSLIHTTLQRPRSAALHP